MRLFPTLFVAFSLIAVAQTQNTVGTVTKFDAQAKTLSLKTDQNQEIAVTLDAKATFRRVAPGETSIANAAPIELSEIKVGDRLIARGKVDGQTEVATMLIVMSQSDLAKRQAADQADWDRRGINGLVSAVSGDTITVTTRTATGARPVTITPAKDAVIRRYAPDSINFVDAKPSKLADVKVGDQVRARGDRSADGSKMDAAEIVSGSFKTIAGVIQSVDATTGEIRIRDIESKKQVVVKVAKDSKMQKIAPQAAQLLAQRVHPDWFEGAQGGRGAQGAQASAGEAQGRGGRGGFGGGRGGAAGGRGGDLQQMLDSSPAVTLAELKNGDAIVVSSTVGATDGRITAITMLAGVEPILTKPGTQEMSLGSWNLDGGGIGAP